ncbi:PREDICTED: uncharacterized protein LOC107352934, partial [Paramuricea clavata]
HLDRNHKLIQPYRFVIHGCIDGYSRKVVFLQASTNNEAATVLSHFQNAVQQYNLPSRVRSDLGFENIEVARLMLQERVQGEAIDLEQYGIDEEGPLTDIEEDYGVIVPEAIVPFSDEK